MRKEPQWVKLFLRELTTTGDVRLAAERAGVGVAGVCERRNNDPEFVRLCLAAFRLRLAWEDEWYERYFAMFPDDEFVGDRPEVLN